MRMDVINSPPPVRSGKAVYVQYGCGLSAPAGWLNYDASPRLKLERAPIIGALVRSSVGALFPNTAICGNIVEGLSVADGSASGVYCSHVLEHIPRDDLPAALRNTLKILAPGGMFRMIVPDLRWRVLHYLSSLDRGDRYAADKFLASCILGKATKPKSALTALREYFGNSAHLWMYDFEEMKALLETAGFEKVRKCDLGDGDPMFELVEEKNRFFEGNERELAIEAIKPRA
jgi:predicted SAM-dependent methyltransferase